MLIDEKKGYILVEKYKDIKIWIYLNIFKYIYYLLFFFGEKYIYLLFLF